MPPKPQAKGKQSGSTSTAALASALSAKPASEERAKATPAPALKASAAPAPNPLAQATVAPSMIFDTTAIPPAVETSASAPALEAATLSYSAPADGSVSPQARTTPLLDPLSPEAKAIRMRALERRTTTPDRPSILETIDSIELKLLEALSLFESRPNIGARILSMLSGGDVSHTSTLSPDQKQELLKLIADQNQKVVSTCRNIRRHIEGLSTYSTPLVDDIFVINEAVGKINFIMESLELRRDPVLFTQIKRLFDLVDKQPNDTPLLSPQDAKQLEDMFGDKTDIAWTHVGLLKDILLREKTPIADIYQALYARLTAAIRGLNSIVSTAEISMPQQFTHDVDAGARLEPANVEDLRLVEDHMDALDTVAQEMVRRSIARSQERVQASIEPSEPRVENPAQNPPMQPSSRAEPGTTPEVRTEIKESQDDLEYTIALLEKINTAQASATTTTAPTDSTASGLAAHAPSSQPGKAPNPSLPESMVQRFNAGLSQQEAEELALALSLVTDPAQSQPASVALTDVPGDGNCFFHAVRDQLQKLRQDGVQPTHAQLRTFAVDYVGAHSDDFQAFIEPGTPAQYVAKMQKDREWVDEIAISACALDNKLRIVILKPQAGSMGVVVHGPANTETIFLWHRPEVHYLSVASIDTTRNVQLVTKLEAEGITIPAALQRIAPDATARADRSDSTSEAPELGDLLQTYTHVIDRTSRSQASAIQNTLEAGKLAANIPNAQAYIDSLRGAIQAADVVRFTAHTAFKSVYSEERQFNTAIEHANDAIETTRTAIEAFQQVQKTYQRSPRTDTLRYSNYALRDADNSIELHKTMIQLVGLINQKRSDMPSIPESVLTAALRASARTLMLVVKSSGDHATAQRALETIRSANLDIKTVEGLAATASLNAVELERIAVISENRVLRRSLDPNSPLPIAVVSRTHNAAWRVCADFAKLAQVKSIAFEEWYMTQTGKFETVSHNNMDLAVRYIERVAQNTERSRGALIGTATAMRDVVQELVGKALADPNPGYDVRAVIRNTVHEFMATALDADGQVDDSIAAIVHSPNVRTLTPLSADQVAELDQSVEQATLESGMSRGTDEFTDQSPVDGPTKTLEQRERDATLARTAGILGVPTQIARELANFDHKPTRAPIEIPDDFGVHEALAGIKTAEANVIRALELRADAEHKDSRSAARYSVLARRHFAVEGDLDAADAILKDASTDERSARLAAARLLLDKEEIARDAHRKELNSQDILASAKTDLIKADQAVERALDDALLAVERAITVLSPIQNPKSYAEAMRIAFSVAVTALGEASKAGNILNSRHLMRLREVISQTNSQDLTEIAYRAVALAASNPTIADACGKAHLPALLDQSVSQTLRELNQDVAETRETFEERVQSLEQIRANGNKAAARQEETAVATDRAEYFNAYSRNIGFRIAVVLGMDADSALTIAGHIQANDALYTSISGQPNIDAALSVRDAAAIAADYAGIAERAVISSSEAYAALGGEHTSISTHEAALKHIKKTFAYQADIARHTATAALRVFQVSDQSLPRRHTLPMIIDDSLFNKLALITSSAQKAALAAFATAIRSSAKMVVDALRIPSHHTTGDDFVVPENPNDVSLRANIVADARSAVRFVLSCIRASESQQAIQDADTVMQTTLALTTQAPGIDFPDSAILPMDPMRDLINEFNRRTVDASHLVEDANTLVTSRQAALNHPPITQRLFVGFVNIFVHNRWLEQHFMTAARNAVAQAQTDLRQAETNLVQAQNDLRSVTHLVWIGLPTDVARNPRSFLPGAPDQNILDIGRYPREALTSANSLASLLHSTESHDTSMPLVASVPHGTVTISLPHEGFEQLFRYFPTVRNVLVRRGQDVRYIARNTDLLVVLPSGVHAELVGQVASNSEGFRLLTETTEGNMGRRGRGAQVSAPPTPDRQESVEMGDLAPGGEAAAPAAAAPTEIEYGHHTQPLTPPEHDEIIQVRGRIDLPAPVLPDATGGDRGTAAPRNSQARPFVLAARLDDTTALTNRFTEGVVSLMYNSRTIGDFIVNSLRPVTPTVADNVTNLLFAACGKGTICGYIAYANETISTPTFVANAYPQLNRTVTVNTGWNALFAGAVALTPYTPGTKAGEIVRFFITDTYLENAPGGLTPALIGPFVIPTIRTVVSYLRDGIASISPSSFTQPAAFAVILLNRDELSKYNATEHGFMPYAAAYGAGFATLITAGPIAAIQTTNVVLKATAIAAVKINGATQCGTIFDLCTSVGLCNTCDTYMALTADREAFIQSVYNRRIKPGRNPYYDSVFASSASEVCSRTTSPANENYSWVESGLAHVVNIGRGLYNSYSYYFNPTAYIDSVCSRDDRTDAQVIWAYSASFVPQPVMNWVVNPALSNAGVFVGTALGILCTLYGGPLAGIACSAAGAVLGGLAWQGVNHYFPEEVEATTNFVSTTISTGLQRTAETLRDANIAASRTVESIKTTWTAYASPWMQTALSTAYEYVSNHKLEVAAGVAGGALTIATGGTAVGMMVGAAGAVSLASQVRTLWSSSDPLSDIRVGALGLAATAVFPHARPALAVVAAVTSIAEGLVVASIRKGNCGLGRFIAEFDVTNGLVLSNTCAELDNIRGFYSHINSVASDDGGLRQCFSDTLTNETLRDLMVRRCTEKANGQAHMAPVSRMFVSEGTTWEALTGNVDCNVAVSNRLANRKGKTNTEFCVSSFVTDGGRFGLQGNGLQPVYKFWQPLFKIGNKANCSVKLIAHSSTWALGKQLAADFKACGNKSTSCDAYLCKVPVLDEAIKGKILDVSTECRQALVDSFKAERVTGLGRRLTEIISDVLKNNTTLTSKDKFETWKADATSEQCGPHSLESFIRDNALPQLLSAGKVSCDSLRDYPSLNYICESLTGMVTGATSDTADVPAN